MKLAFFNYLPLEYGGGLARFFGNTAQELHTRYPSLSITIITLDKAFANRISRLYSIYFATKRHALPFYESTSRLKKSLPGVTYSKVGSFKELKLLLSKQDCVYTKNDILELLLLRFLSVTTSLPPYIIGYHTPIIYDRTPSVQAILHNILYDSLLYHHLISNAAGHHVLNRHDQIYLETKGIRSIVKLPNPFDFKTFSSSYKRKAHSHMRFLWTGRLTEQKGVTDLLDIISAVNRTDYAGQIEWHIAGTGELELRVREYAKHTPNVIYHGYVPADKIARLYADSDIFLSTAKWESLPYSFLEALSYNLPIVTYAIRGAKEIISSHQVGFLVSTTPEFIDTILSLIKKKKPIRIGKTADLKKKFSGDSIYPAFYRNFIAPYE